MTQAVLYKIPGDSLLPGNSKGYDLVEFKPEAADTPSEFIARNSITDYVVFESGEHNTRDNINYSLRFRHSMYIDNGVPVFDLEVSKKIAKALIKNSLRNPQRKTFNESDVPEQLLMLQLTLPVDQRHPLAQTAIDRITAESNNYFGILDQIESASTIDQVMDITYPVGTSPDFIRGS